MKKNALQYPTEFLNSLSSGILPDHVITLKKDFIFMLLKNIITSRGYCNGNRYIFQHMKPLLLSLKVSAGKIREINFSFPIIPCHPESDDFPVPYFWVTVSNSYLFYSHWKQSTGKIIFIKNWDRSHWRFLCIWNIIFGGLSWVTYPINVIALNPKTSTAKTYYLTNCSSNYINIRFQWIL